MENIHTSKLFERMYKRFINHKLKPYQARLEQIKHCRLDDWTNQQIQERSLQLKQEARIGRALDDLLVEAFALVNEVFWRVMQVRLYDVQIVAGIAMHEGNLVEMQTGEGKTFAAVTPAYLNALTGKGVHILTFNDYLANRDSVWMAPIYEYLGVSVCCVTEAMSLADRRMAYAADVLYSTAKQAGFDYLKDTLCYDADSIVQRPFYYAIVDEADSILLDEARIPLAIAGEEVSSSSHDWHRMAVIARELSLGQDYDTDEHKRNVYLMEAGIDRIEAQLDCGNLYDDENGEILAALHTALHAEALLKRDVDYIVRDGKIELVDEFTGRVADKRHYPDGIHAAVEAKEGIISRTNGKVLGSITLQHFMSMYPKLSGMTATAKISADEFRQTYCLEVVEIPPNLPCRRLDHPHLIYTHQEAKYKALVKETVSIYETGRPILIGTASVEESDDLALRLQKQGIDCSVLNAMNDEMEAAIIARAGELGAVTVSTNMAGRGVDIVLGGEKSDNYATIAELGGLYVIGTSLHESIRIDQQLRGRAGRQGDPGSSRFFVSLEDELMNRFGIHNTIPTDYISLRQDEPLDAPAIHKAIAHIQRVMVGQNHEIRKTLNKYADLIEEQRQILYNKRRKILTDQVELDLLASRMFDKYQHISRHFGELTAKKIEKHITLLEIDRCWADDLDYIAYVREGIHLESISNKNPIDEFHRQIIPYYEKLPIQIEDRILSRFHLMGITHEQIDLNQEVLRVPAATWTYMVNDSFYQNRVTLF